MTTLRASIDLGTNTCLLLISECGLGGQGVTRVVEDHATVVRLGQGVDSTRKLDAQAMERTISCLKRYAERVSAQGIALDQAICVATSQARDAQNGAEFFARVQSETGFVFRVLSGSEEARLTFVGGLLPGMDARRAAVIDIGGGSTEFMALTGGVSLDVGSVRFTERYLKTAPDQPVSDDQFWECQDAIDLELEPLRQWRRTLLPQTQLVGVAGTATTLAAWHLGLTQFDASKVDQVTLTRGDVHRQVEDLKWRTPNERRELPGVEEGRADVLLAGALILWRSLEILSFPEVRVSTRGLRFGILTLQ